MCVYTCVCMYIYVCVYTLGYYRGSHKHLSEKEKYNMVSSSQLMIDMKISYTDRHVFATFTLSFYYRSLQATRHSFWDSRSTNPKTSLLGMRFLSKEQHKWPRRWKPRASKWVPSTCSRNPCSPAIYISVLLEVSCQTRVNTSQTPLHLRWDLITGPHQWIMSIVEWVLLEEGRVTIIIILLLFSM